MAITTLLETRSSLLPSCTIGVILALHWGTCLAWLERSCAGELGYEAGGALGAGGGKRSEDLPGTGASLGFITAGDFACDHRWPQLAFGQRIWCKVQI
jgi:hypothetical protein